MIPLQSVSVLLVPTPQAGETKLADSSQPAASTAELLSFKAHWKDELAKGAAPMNPSGQAKSSGQSIVPDPTKGLKDTTTLNLDQTEKISSSLLLPNGSDNPSGTSGLDVSLEAHPTKAVQPDSTEDLSGKEIESGEPTDVSTKYVSGRPDVASPARQAGSVDKPSAAVAGARSVARKHSEEVSAPFQPTELPVPLHAPPNAVSAPVQVVAPAQATTPVPADPKEVVPVRALSGTPDKLVAAPSKPAPAEAAVSADVVPADASTQAVSKTLPGRTAGESETAAFTPTLHVSGVVIGLPAPASEVSLPAMSAQRDAVGTLSPGSHVSPEHGRWIASSAAAEPALLAASPGALEVGVQSVTHGWVRVRAEVDQHTGSVSAMMLAPTAHSAASLDRELPAMQAYLVGEHVAVGSLTVSHERSADGQPLLADMQNQSGSGRQERSDSAAGVQAAGEEGSDSTDLETEARLPAIYSGGWLNVLA